MDVYINRSDSLSYKKEVRGSSPLMSTADLYFDYIERSTNMTEVIWRCDKCGKEREKAVPGLVKVEVPSNKMSQPCECGGKYYLVHKPKTNS